jgi:hypothetical protein
MAWGIQEGNFTTAGFNFLSTDMLGNTTGFTRGHFSTSDVIEQ